LWLIIDGKVYDVSGFEHPGTVELLVEHANGTDAHEDFEAKGHSKGAKDYLKTKLIGELENEGSL
jgi:cytochrome b involved in lipid metabolism